MLGRFRSALYHAIGAESGEEPDLVRSVQHGLKYPYQRPLFLQLFSDEKLAATCDHVVRPIIVPRDMSTLPYSAGYAECINAGKSPTNEDQCTIHAGVLRTSDCPDRTTVQGEIPYTFYGLFDGHAGSGCAVVAANELHSILHEHLTAIVEHLIIEIEAQLGHSLQPDEAAKLRLTTSESLPNHLVTSPDFVGDRSQKSCPVDDSGLPGHREGCLSVGQGQPKMRPDITSCVTSDDLIVGALESAFWAQDDRIGEDKTLFRISGGCTALVALCILGKVFVANAGDSRAVIVHRNSSKSACSPMSFDFTPVNERQRIQSIAHHLPGLLGDEFTAVEYLGSRRPMSRDVGSKMLVRHHYMSGFAYKTITQDDLVRFPLVYGTDKRSRLMATIGVTRGFGDHELRAQSMYTLGHTANLSPAGLPIKPFLTAQPEVRVFDGQSVANKSAPASIGCPVGEEFDEHILVLGTDGLWDVVSNDRVAEIVGESLAEAETSTAIGQFKYVSVAQSLVGEARGKPFQSEMSNLRTWRKDDNVTPATVDDISVVIVPLTQVLDEHTAWLASRSQRMRTSSRTVVGS